MFKTSFTAALAALVLWLPALSAQVLEGEEIAGGKTYAAGTQLKSAVVGVSFKVPLGVKAAPSAEYGVILLQPSGGSRGGILVIRTGITLDDAKSLLTEELDLSFMVGESDPLERRAGPTTEGDKTTWRYSNDDLKARALAVHATGKGGYILLMFDTNDDKAHDAVKDFDKSTVTVAPAAAEQLKHWRSQVESKELVSNAGGQTISCKFSKDGSYALKISAGEQNVTQSGSWRVEVSPFGGTLIMKASDGEYSTLSMALSGNDLTLNGMTYSRKNFEDGGKVSTEEGKLPKPDEAKDKGKARKVERDPNWKTDQKEVEKLEGEEITFNVMVQGEKRLKTDFLGVSFKLPAGIAGGADARYPFYIMRPLDQRGIGLVYAQTGVNTAADAAAVMAQDLDLSSLEAGLVLKPSGKADIESGKVTQDYSSGQYTARAVALVGPSGNGILVCFIGAAADKDRMHNYVKDVIGSVQFAKPQAETKRSELVKQLHGKCLHVFRYKSSSAGSGNSSSWETNIWYHFGSDGTYYYRYKFTGDHYMKGADWTGGAVNENDREETGKWRVEFNMAGAIVYRTSDQGVEYEHQIRVDGNKVFLDGDEVTVGQSDKKR